MEILQQAAESYAKSDLAAMKGQMAAELGVDPDQLIVFSATDGDDRMEIYGAEDGGITIYLNGEEHTFTAEEAKYLIINVL